jgi:hypothetical protein
MRRRVVGVMCVVAGVALGAPASGLSKPPPPKKAHKVVPAVHLCAWIAAAGAAGTLKLEGTCKETHGKPKTIHTPKGSYTSTFYTARWLEEKATVELVPHHTLSVGVAHITSSSTEVLSFFQKQERAKVLENGVLVANGKGVLATWAGDTSSCKNPPTGDCTTSEFESTKGNWGVALTAKGAPPTGPDVEKDESNGDDPEDLAQEEAMKGDTVGVGLAITAHL